MTYRATSAAVARSAGLRDVVVELGEWAQGSGPLFRQLARAIAGGIERGALASGSRLPAERALASELAVSRGTAVAAYDLLVGQGVVERRRGSGTYVLDSGVLSLPPGREGSALVHRLVDRSASSTEVIDLSISVLSDAEGLPLVSIASPDLLDVVPATGYSPWGLPGLRRAVAAHVTSWGLPTSEGEVVITTGAQQGISAAAACWVSPGDNVVVEDPTYPGAIVAFMQAGAQVIGVPVDRFGVRPQSLRAAIEQHRPSLVYLQSAAHSPTGATLSVGRRQEIAAVITASRVPVIEDVALHDLCWSPPPAPIATWCPTAPVAVIGSLSKLFWGGLRVGFVRAPEPVALRFARVKAAQDLGSSAVSQIMAERLLASLGTSDFLRRRHEQLRSRYDVLAGGLRRALPSWTWPEPAGGLSIWVRLPGEAASRLATGALRHGVAVATAEALSPSDRHADRIRLSFSDRPEVLGEGVARLASAWAELGR